MIIVNDEYVTLDTPSGPMRTHIVRPAAPGRYPAIIFYSEIFQITAPIRRTAAMLAGHGYIEDTGGFLCAGDCKTGDDGFSIAELMTLATNSTARASALATCGCSEWWEDFSAGREFSSRCFSVR